MTPIDNSGFLNICGNCDCPGFVPAVSWSYNGSTKQLTLTDASTFPSADAIAAINIKVSDGKGHVQQARIAAAGGSTTVDLTTGGFILAPEGFNILATVVSIARCIADMSAYNVNATVTSTGTLGNTDLEGDANGDLSTS